MYRSSHIPHQRCLYRLLRACITRTKKPHNHLRSLHCSNPRQTIRLEYRFCVIRLLALIIYLHEPNRRLSLDFRGDLLGMPFSPQIIHLENARHIDWRLLSFYKLLLSLAPILLSELPALHPHIFPVLQRQFVLTISQHFTHFPAQALFGVQLNGAPFQIEKP